MYLVYHGPGTLRRGDKDSFKALTMSVVLKDTVRLGNEWYQEESIQQQTEEYPRQGQQSMRAPRIQKIHHCSAAFN